MEPGKKVIAPEQYPYGLDLSALPPKLRKSLYVNNKLWFISSIGGCKTDNIP